MSWLLYKSHECAGEKEKRSPEEEDEAKEKNELMTSALLGSMDI